MEATTLCYIEKEEKYLMLYRNKRNNDINKGKWIGVGGHLLKGESPEDCLKREVLEETGLTLKSFQHRGTLYFEIDDLKEVSYLFTATPNDGKLLLCDEGELSWIPKKDILKLSLWEGDYLFLNKLLNNEAYFEMKLIYKNDKLMGYEVIK